MTKEKNQQQQRKTPKKPLSFRSKKKLWISYSFVNGTLPSPSSPSYVVFIFHFRLRSTLLVVHMPGSSYFLKLQKFFISLLVLPTPSPTFRPLTTSLRTLLPSFLENPGNRGSRIHYNKTLLFIRGLRVTKCGWFLLGEYSVQVSSY